MIEQVRVSAARRHLELGREAPKKVAVDCGCQCRHPSPWMQSSGRSMNAATE
jgi:hypothetical protein